MIGAKTFDISNKDALRGESTSSDLQDGGFSPETDAVNLTAQPGIINAVAAPVDASTSVTGNFIASCEDFSGVTNNNRYFVDDAGAYYSFNGTSITKQATAGSGTYTDGKTDMIPFALGFLTTTTTDITLWNGAATLNTNWWTTTKGQVSLNGNVPHPQVVFQKIAWIADGNLLHKVTEAGVVTYAFLTLASTDTITAIDVEPGSGSMLIAVTTGQNLSDTLSRTAKVHYFDGFSNKPTRTVIVEDQITSFLIASGTVYAFYGQNFGIYTGSGLRFLRALNVALSNTPSGTQGGLVWKNRRCTIGTTLYYVEGSTITAFGNIRQRGDSVFWPAYKNNANTNALNLICNVGSNKIGMSFPTTKFYTVDMSSIATTNTMALYSNKYEFDHPIWLRQIWIFYKNGVAAGVSPGSITFYDETGNPIQSIGNSGLLTLMNVSGATEYVHKIINIDAKVSTAKFRTILDNGVVGFRRAIIMYDFAEL